MSFFKMLFAFAPWLAFLFIAHGSLFRLKLGLGTALILSIVMGITRLHRGIILWVGLAFFTLATVAVAALENMWIVRHMGILASGTLAAATWLTVATGKPFTMDYAREHTDPSLWKNPIFIRINFIITSVWGATFSINAVLAWGKMEHFILPEWGYEVLSYTILVGSLAFSSRYPAFVREKRKSEVEAAASME
jgi:magnesium-transporting ATPase (P-type)